MNEMYEHPSIYGGAMGDRCLLWAIAFCSRAIAIL
jgi:hypothetical protein